MTDGARKTRSQQQLIDWAAAVFRHEGPQLAPRIATVREGAIEHFTIDRAFQLRGLVQAASVLGRSVGAADMVVALSPGGSSRALEATEWGAVADVRSREGHRTLRMLGARPRAGSTQYWQREFPASLVAHLGDWEQSDYEVEPWVEVQVARLGVPGALGGGSTATSAWNVPPAIHLR